MPRHLSSHSSSSSNHEQQCVFNEKTGRLECVFVNLEAVYPETGNLAVEYCFEELRARHRGWLDKEPKKAKAGQQKKLTKSESFDIQLDTPTPLQEQKKEEQAPIANSVAKEKPFAIFSDAQQDTPESRPTSKQKGFKIFEDTDLEPKQPPKPEATSSRSKSTTKTLALNDENDENTPPSKQEIDAAKKARREERANRTRKIKVMEVQHIKNETQTIKLNMDSPKSKPKRRKSVAPEPTMTINTKEAMDEIYGIFSAPLPSQSEQQQEEESEEESESESESDEDDYTTGDESTATGKLSAPASEYGDETRNELLGASQRDEDRTDVSGWSDFDTGKHVPKEGDESGMTSAQSTVQDVYEDMDDDVTPVNDENPQTRYVPVAPEDYEPPVMQMRDMSMLPNHRLPFMTPIVEQTESSLGIPTGRPEKDYFGAKTPSRKNGMPEDFDEEEEEDDEPPSSPFDDVTADMAEDKRRVLQPIRTKSTKGTLSLGQGTSKAQIDAKLEGPATVDTVQKGPIVKDLQCNPMDPYLRESILSQMKPSLTTYEGYHEHLDAVSGKTAEIKKYIKQLQASRKSQSQSQEKTSSIPPMVAFPGAGGIYTIKRELGAGTFAPVYLVENSAAGSLEEREDLLGDEHDDVSSTSTSRLGKLTHRRPLEAIKMEEPPSTWEFYILRATHRRLGVSRASESIVKAHEMHLFRDECFLVEEFRDQGTLLDLVNIARLESGSGGGMDEMLCMFFSIELLRTVEAMHSKQLIHGDLKGDNILVRFDDPGMETDWSNTYFPSGAHGWSSKGVCLIDFGRGIDMKHFEEKVAFIADWKTTDADCAEMRELRPWTYQIDYHGLAGIVHSLLFGKYMETSADKGASLGHGATKTYRIRESFKRYWQTEIWSELFALLLNPLMHVENEEGKKLPVVRSMRSCRERMEGWLEENCERGVGLKGMISRMEGAIRDRKRKGVRS